MRDRLDGLWHDGDFAGWYPCDGRQSLARPAGHRLRAAVPARPVEPSDRQTAEAVRCRIDFVYSLAMELDDPGFHHSVLADFRDRLTHDESSSDLRTIDRGAL
ncbi:transposase [Kitasatospora sp. NPDC094028]